MRVNRGLRGDSSLPKWLRRMVHRVSFDSIRQAYSRKDGTSFSLAHASGVEDSRPDSDAPSPESTTGWTEMSRCMQNEVEALRKSYCEVLVLHDMHGLTYREIAEVLGCSFAAVRSRLYRARTMLRDSLGSGYDFARDERGVSVRESKSPSSAMRGEQ